MTEEFVVHLIREAFITTLLVAAPVLLLSLIVGLIISIIQAATSIQEVTLTFVPKLVIIGVVLVITLPWMIDVMTSFTTDLFGQIPNLTK
ncbi:MAG: flagellar biosynthesis protein FliQ [Bacteroidetes bacterium]|nr:MAG: flagellar biosynthesis protein FliQ [Bacteroidota bacterium]